MDTRPVTGGRMGGPTVRVEGLNELIRDLRAMDREFGNKAGLSALNAEMTKAANVVATEARQIAPYVGMHGTQRRRLDRDGKPYGKPRKGYRPGRTVKSTRGTSRKNQGVVQVRAKDPKTGFHYPLAYEFGAWSGSGPTNPERPFLYPAAYNKQDEVARTLADGLMRVIKYRNYWGDSPGGGVTVG